ncbi:hypothetical protein [Agrobacterium vitis]|uniref:hypothetical protein n=1 Tax=Agrobacterium vitis TaxID=373 RepID=UPI001572C1FC|nr:hypothetical protein [Agrobacterium vitis]NSZ48456.1 hypothetical protein [Agrobacterium vitis]UJL73052.1 hypothetical protein AVCG412_09630 [Agrobacterium vitis]WEO73783.1 hypothetical protein G6L01_020830 [Agrobacterium vitis]
MPRPDKVKQPVGLPGELLAVTMRPTNSYHDGGERQGFEFEAGLKPLGALEGLALRHWPFNRLARVYGA